MSSKTHELIEDIERAFAGVPMPAKESLADGPMSWYDADVLKHFGGQPRGALPSRLTRLLGEDLFYMTAAGVHYYLPAFFGFFMYRRRKKRGCRLQSGSQDTCSVKGRTTCRKIPGNEPRAKGRG